MQTKWASIIECWATPLYVSSFLISFAEKSIYFLVNKYILFIQKVLTNFTTRDTYDSHGFWLTA